MAYKIQFDLFISPNSMFNIVGLFYFLGQIMAFYVSTKLLTDFSLTYI